MSKNETWQVDTSAAEVYEEKLVPALFGEWTAHCVEAAGVKAGDHVLDVACGTGVVARAVAPIVGDSGSVVGIDKNEGMLAIAQRVRPELEWRKGDVETLPFEDDSFDAVICQAALMYFPDPGGALQEMRRVAKPDGVVVIQVWGELKDSPCFVKLIELTRSHIGDRAHDILAAPFVLSDKGKLMSMFEEVGFSDINIKTRIGKCRYPTCDEFVRAEVEASPIAPALREKNEDAYNAYFEGASEELAEFCLNSGEIVFDLPGHIIAARR